MIKNQEYLDCKEGNELYKIKNKNVTLNNCTAFGVVLSGHAIVNGRIAYQDEYFCVTNIVDIISNGDTALFIRKNWNGKNIYAGGINDEGDVKYIDGCTDSLLVCPPRLGDPCLNALYFPANTIQTFHTHPSQRLGAVLKGSGFACFDDREEELKEGDVFFIETNELHRFRTEKEKMIVIAYHPDSDWGPTDEIHPMINRTII